MDFSIKKGPALDAEQSENIYARTYYSTKMEVLTMYYQSVICQTRPEHVDKVVKDLEAHGYEVIFEEGWEHYRPDGEFESEFWTINATNGIAVEFNTFVRCAGWNDWIHHHIVVTKQEMKETLAAMERTMGVTA